MGNPWAEVYSGILFHSQLPCLSVFEFGRGASLVQSYDQVQGRLFPCYFILSSFHIFLPPVRCWFRSVGVSRFYLVLPVGGILMYLDSSAGTLRCALTRECAFGWSGSSGFLLSSACWLTGALCALSYEVYSN